MVSITSDDGSQMTARKRLTLPQIVVLVLALVGLSLPALQRVGRDLSRRGYERDRAEFFQPLRLAQEHLEQRRYLQALGKVDTAIAVGARMTDLRESDLADAHQLKAEIHMALWQYIDAERALGRAIDLADSGQRRRFRERLARVRDVIKRTEVEREESSVYYAGRDQGPAKRLSGKVVIIYVFVDAGRGSDWTHRQRLFAVRILKQVERWYAERARDWSQREPVFSERVFNYTRDPWLDRALHRLGSGEEGVGFELARRVAQLRGEDIVNRFLETIAIEEGAQQAMLLLHVKKEARSYAVPCYRPSWCTAEYAYVLAAPTRNSWERIKYLAAHEGLHLFGADDLYNIRGGRAYAPRDVMHRPSRFLVASTVDSLTAYAIGWSDHVPAAPFKIITTE